MPRMLLLLVNLLGTLVCAEDFKSDRSFVLKVLEKNLGSNSFDCHRGFLEEFFEDRAQEKNIELCFAAPLRLIVLTEYQNNKQISQQVLKDQTFQLEMPSSQSSPRPLILKKEVKKFSMLNALSEMFIGIGNKSFFSQALLWTAFDWKTSLQNKKLELSLEPKSELMNLRFAKMSFDEKYLHLNVFEAKLLDPNARYVFRVNKFKRWSLKEGQKLFNLQPK